ncbi:DUF3048 domain-containing protein [Parasphingorhabdus pacifica]
MAFKRRWAWLVGALVVVAVLVVAATIVLQRTNGAVNGAGPVTVVKVDNAPAARPPTGIGAADLVYVEPVEGGLNRMAAVFASEKPEVVGPVRSARETDLRLLPELGRPALAFSGAAPELLPLIEDAQVLDASPARVPDAYYRDDSRSIPHNLYVRPDQLPRGEVWSAEEAFRFGDAPGGGQPTQHREVRYTASSVGFDWSDGQRRWLVSMDGQPFETADSGRAAAANVIVQTVPVRESSFEDSEGSVSPFADTVGSGEATVLRDGQSFQARWSRPSVEATTTYTTPEGEPMPMAPGNVWIVLTAG